MRYSEIILTELFANGYPVENVGSMMGSHVYKFVAAGEESYSVIIKKRWDTDARVDFIQSNNKGRHWLMTGTQGLTSVKLFSTVLNIVRSYLSQHPEIETVTFEGDDNEPSRLKLYHALATKFGKGYKTYEVYQGVSFVVNV